MELERAPNEPDRQQVNPWLKIALELGPIVVFFLTNSYGDRLAERFPVLASLGEPIFIATAFFIVATLISLVASLALTRRVPIMPLVTAVFVVVFGGLTLWLQDETFIKMKPTIINTMFGIILLGGLAFGKALLGYVLDSAFKLTNEGWRVLTFRWGLFFFVLAILNEVVWRTVSTDMWVNFKTFGIMPITIVFGLFQLPLLNRYALPEEGAKN